MKLTKIVFWVLVFSSFAFASCFSPWTGDATVITLNFGGTAASGRALSDSEGSNFPDYRFFQKKLEHTVVLSGPSGTIERTVSPDEGTVQIEVLPGNWKIGVRATLNKAPYAQCFTEVDVKLGRNNPVAVKMLPLEENPYREKFDVAAGGLGDTLARLHAQDGYHYILELQGGQDNLAPQSLYFDDMAVSITLKGGTNSPVISGPGPVFSVGAGVTLILDNVTISGRGANGSDSLVVVRPNGRLVMKGESRITGNTTERGGAVSVQENGIFSMFGGEIANNTATQYGGGVYIYKGYFVKTGGTIYGVDGDSPGNYSNSVRTETGLLSGKGHAVYAFNGAEEFFRDTTPYDDLWFDGNTMAHIIYTADDLKKMDLDKNYTLMADLAITGNWTPIGTGTETAFEGIFDGNGHTINMGTTASPLTITTTTGGNNDYAGLFGRVSNGTIKNLRLKGSIRTDGGTGKQYLYAGAVAGYNVEGTIMNVSSSVKVNNTAGSGNNTAGGIVGSVENGTIENCISEGDVSGTRAGGIAGELKGGTITHCWASGDINTTGTGTYAGGIVAQVTLGTTSYCVALNGSVAATNAGRVAGNTGNGVVMRDNYGISTMKVNGAAVSVSDIHGGDIGVGADTGWWTNAGWKFTGASNAGEQSPWVWANGRPRLWFEN